MFFVFYATNREGQSREGKGEGGRSKFKFKSQLATKAPWLAATAKVEAID